MPKPYDLTPEEVIAEDLAKKLLIRTVQADISVEINQLALDNYQNVIMLNQTARLQRVANSKKNIIKRLFKK